MKRRRPSKKLVTTLQSLANALPEAEEFRHQDDDPRIQHKSIKTRPGAMKRRAKLEAMEKDRFQKNLVQMASRQSTDLGDTDHERSTATSGRWMALRNFIGATMRTDPPN